MAALETTGEVVVTIVVTTARYTRVATITEFKPDLNNSPFTKRQLLPLQRAAPAAAPHQPIKGDTLNIIHHQIQ